MTPGVPPHPTNQLRVINTSRGKTAKLPGKVSLQCLSIYYSSIPQFGRFKVVLKHGDVSYMTPVSDLGGLMFSTTWYAYTNFYLLPCH